MRRVAPALAVLCGAALVGCGSGVTTPSTGGQALCTTPTEINLEVGAVRFVDALRETSCVNLVAGDAEREYLFVLYSAEGQASQSGVSGDVGIRTSLTQATGTGASVVASPAVVDEPWQVPAFAQAAPGSAAAFHQMLRVREGEVARSPFGALSRAGETMSIVRGVPVLGEKDTFNVCSTTACSNFNRVAATARFVGRHGVIYVDDSLPTLADQLTPTDIQQLGTLFDDHLFPLDTTAFGRESDINGDERIAILISDEVNALTPDCSSGRIVGYFFGGDLILTFPGSNKREVFFAFAPVQSKGNCPSVSRATALRSLPPVLIHELQHMISFNQHSLRRNGDDETLWLNEGLSHYAEELGFRAIPDQRCINSSSCFTEFMSGNLFNAFEYLRDPQATHLIAPTRPGGPLAERGAGWLFVSWLTDHFATDTLRGTDLTRRLVQTSNTGAQNVVAVTGVPFATLVGEWHLANYLENLPGFPQQGRLRYRSFDLRDVFGRNFPTVFSRPYPLEPSVSTGQINRTGPLRGGSGAHLRVQVPANGGGINVRVNGSSDVARVPAAIEPRMAVVRIR